MYPIFVGSLDHFGKVHIFWEGHKILRNLHLTFVYNTYRQKEGGDFAKFCGFLRIYGLYQNDQESQQKLGTFLENKLIQKFRNNVGI